MGTVIAMGIIDGRGSPAPPAGDDPVCWAYNPEKYLKATEPKQ